MRLASCLSALCSAGLLCAGLGAPAAGAQTTEPVVHEPSSAITPQMSGPAYIAARGGFGYASEMTVTMSRTDLGGGARVEGELAVLVGEDWVLEQGNGPVTLYDFAEERTVEFDREAETFSNLATHALARRNLDVYVALSDRGMREQIDFADVVGLDRFWLEAAMGISAREADVELSVADDTLTAVRGDETVTRIGFGTCHSPALNESQAAAFNAWLVRAAPVHPTVSAALLDQDRAPCALSFVIYSPDSPQGREESWSIESADMVANADVFASGDSVALPGPDLLQDLLWPAVLEAVRGEAGDTPGPITFMDDIESLREAGDLAGALLLSIRETHHFGPCPTATIGSARLACTSMSGLRAQGIGNADFERVAAGLAAVDSGDHAGAIAALRPSLSRQDRAGAAARTLVANELVAWGREGLEAHEELDPARLLAEAIVLDPLAPDTYWYLGERFLVAGSPETAFTLFELGSALPGRDMTPLLQQSVELKARIEDVAPAYFPAAFGLNPD